jgi:hypothetical protein
MRKIVRILDATDKSLIGQVGDLEQKDASFVLTMYNQCITMFVVIAVPKGDQLHVTTTQGEIFVFEDVKEDDYGLLANSRIGDWYVEVEEQIATGDKWLLIEHPGVPLGAIRVSLVENDLQNLISALQEVAKHDSSNS